MSFLSKTTRSHSASPCGACSVRLAVLRARTAPVSVCERRVDEVEPERGRTREDEEARFALGRAWLVFGCLHVRNEALLGCSRRAVSAQTPATRARADEDEPGWPVSLFGENSEWMMARE